MQLYADDHEDKVVHNGNGLIKKTWVGGVFSSRPEDAPPEMLIDKRLSLFGQYIQTKEFTMPHRQEHAQDRSQGDASAEKLCAK